MKNNYNSLSFGRFTRLKNGIGKSEGSPPGSSFKFSSFSLLIVLMMFLTTAFSYQSWAQTTIISGTSSAGSFESGSLAADGWSTAQSSINAWVVGTAGGATHGTNGAYVNSTATNGGTFSYNTGSTQANHIYRDFTWPAGENSATLTFDLKGAPADAGFDRIRVYVCPTTVTPVAGTEATTGATQVYSNDAAVAAFTTQTVTFNKSQTGFGATARIIITWRNDGSVGSGNPYAIDKVNLVTAPSNPVSSTATIGGLWSNAATWGGTVPAVGTNVTIPAGVIVTVDQVVTVGDLTVNGTLQWNGTANALTTFGNLVVNSGGTFLPYSTGQSGVAITVGGTSFQNDGYANLALSSINFVNASGATLSGTGVFQGDGTKGILRTLSFQNVGSNAVSTSQNLIVTSGLTHTAGSLSTNGKLTIDNTAQVYGQAFNLQVANLAVTTMGAGYTVAPVVYGSAVTQYASGLAATLNTKYVSGSNVYLCTTAGTFNATAPTSTDLQATFATSGPTLLFIGTVGNLGTNLPYNSALTVGTIYFHGDNVYQALTTASIVGAANMPVHTSGTVGNLRYLGSVAKATVNFDATTGSVRSLNLTQAGSGFAAAPSIAFSVGVAGGTVTTAASATAVLFQKIDGVASSLFQKSGGAATISGGLTINSDQGTSLATTNEQASSGVGAISTSNGGVNYTVAPTVGFTLPTAINLINNPGSGYTTTPTVTVTGGNLVAGTAITTSSFTIAVNNGKVQAVYLSTPGTAVYSTLPTLTLTTSPGVTATLSFPAGCLPAATANIGANGQLTSFTMTNAGYGYITAPTVGIGTTSGTANGGTFTTVASAPAARIALYNLTSNFFLPASVAVVQGEDAAIPSSRKINTLTLSGNGNGLNLSSNLVLFGSSPLSLTASLSVPGNIINLGGNNLLFTNNSYGGTTGTFSATTNTYIKNGSMTLIGRGGASSFNFPFAGTFNWSAGSTPTAVTTGSTVTRVTVTETAAPSNSTLGTGIAVGARAFRAQYANIGTGADAVLPTTGTNPTVTMNFNSVDALTANTQDQLLLSDATSLTGPWNAKSVSSGSGAITAATTGSRTTATTAPGPIVPSGDNYYAWSTSAPTITAVTPLVQCANSGTFTVTGTNLTGVANVQIGGTPVSSFTIVNSTTMTGVTGNGTSGFLSFSKNGQTITGTESITVNPSPTAPSITALTSTTVNLGGSVSLQATGTLAGGTINWYSAAVGGTLLGSTPDDGTTPFNYNACSSTTIYAAENSGGCDGPRTGIAMTVNPTAITASIPRFCGTGGDTVLTATPSDSNILYTWTSISGAALSSTTGESVTATALTSSDFTVTATRGTCSATASYSVSVYPLPTAAVTTTASGVCPGTSATIGSGLSAGNFTVASTTYKPYTIPSNAVTVIDNTSSTASLSGGSLDDGGWAGIPIGFNFNFFGSSFSSIAAGTNGLLMFGTVPGYGTGAGQLGQYSFNTTGGVFPNVNNPGNVIALMAGDQTFGGAGKLVYWTEGIAPNRKFILLYEGVPNCCTSTNPKFTAYVTLYETLGIVDVSILSKLNTNSCTVGLQDSTKTIGAVATGRQNFSSTITTPEAWRFTPPSNYTTVWTKTDTSGTSTIASGTNIFSQTVSPLETTTYSISYTNQTTTCTNAPGSAQVVMSIISNTAPDALAVSSAATVCAGSSANLSLTNTTGGAYTNNIGSSDALTYQWQFSLNGGSTWTDVAGATSATATVTPTAVTQYRCNIKSCTQTVATSSSPVTIGSTNLVDTVTGAARCGSGSVTISATTSTAGATLTWYADATTATALGTGATYTANVTQVGTGITTYTYYVAAVTSGPACSSFRTPVTVTVNPAPVFTLDGSSSQSTCTGGSGVTLQSADADFYYDTFTVTPTTGATLTNDGTTLTLALNPTTTTTYTLLGTQSFGDNCGYSIPITVTVNPLPVITAVSASPAAVCLGSTSTLNANLPSSGYTFAASTGATLDPMTGATTVLFSGNDDTPTAASAPIGFNFSFNGVTYSDYSVSPDGWILLGTTTASSSFSNSTTLTSNIPKLYPYWDDLATGTDGDVKTLVTGTAGNRIFKVQWHVTVPRATGGPSDSSFQAWLYEATGKVEYRYGTMGAQTAGSASAGYTVNATNYSSITLSTNSASTTTPNDTNAGVPASGTMYTYAPVIPGTVTWAPITGLYTDAGATTPYTGGTAATVYAKPAATTVYYATATASTGCSVTDAGVTVTVNTDPVAEVTGGATSICLAGTTPDNDAQTPAAIDFDTATTGVTWESSNTAVATIDANGVLTPLSEGTTNVRAFIYNPGTGCTTYSPNTVAVNVYAPIKITLNPNDASALAPASATFTAAATGSGLAYQWQSSSTGTSESFVDIAGATSTTLSVSGVSATTYYRCQVSGSSPCSGPKYTGTAVLTVTCIAITTPASQTVCQNNGTDTSTTATVSAVITGETPDGVLWQVNDGTGFVFIDSESFGGLTYSGFDTDTLVISGLTAAQSGYQYKLSAAYTNPDTQDTCEATSGAATITVNARAVINSAPTTNAICYTGGTTTFHVDATGATGYQWNYFNGTTWAPVSNDVPAGVIYSGATSASLVITADNTVVPSNYLYQVVLSSPATCGTTTSGNYTFTSNTPTFAATVTSANASFCSPSGAPVALAVAPTGTTAASTYVWSTVPASSYTATGAAVNVSPAATTVYQVTGTDGTGCSGSTTITVVSSLAITATLTASASTVCPETPVTISATAIGGGPQVAPTGYPASNATSTSDEDILNVTFGSINNTSTCSTTGGSGSILNEYSDFTSLPAAIVSPGQTLPISISVGTCGGNFTNYTNVYIDYNRNGAFESNEQAFTEGTGVSGAHLVTGSITIPTNATAGVTRMRVYVVEFGSSTSSPSVTYSWGETEDYNINILTDVTSMSTYSWSSVPADATLATETGSSITRTPSENTTYTVSAVSAGGCATTASTTVTTQSGAVIATQPASSTVCAGTTATFTVVASGPGLTYQWSKNGVAITGNASATTATLTLTGTTPADNGAYSVLVHPICGDDAVSDGLATLTVNPLPTATISGTATACTNGTAPVVTLTGANGTAPYTFTYSLNGAANQTIVSDGSGVATITAPITVTGNFVYTLKSVVDSSSTACSQVQTGSATISVNAAPTALSITGTTSVCSNDNPVLLTATGAPAPAAPAVSTYCASTHTSGCSGDNIQRVVLNTLNKITSTTCGTTSSAYSNFSGLTGANTTTLTAGNSYSLSLTFGTDSNQYFGAWIDYNHDGVYSSSEFLGASANAGSGGTTAVSFIPSVSTALNGLTHMRIVGGNDSAVSAGQACGASSSTWGETQDYDVTIINPVTTTWSSTGGGLYTDAAGTVAYTGGNSTTVYAKPSATSTITASATNIAGCTVSTNATFTVTPSTTTEYSVTACGTYHWSINGSDYTTSGNYTYVSGCHTDVLHLTISCTSVLNLKVAIQGYRDTVAHAMRPVMANQGVGTSTTNVDDIIVSLRDVTDYHVVASTTAKLQTNGDALCTYSTAPSGTFYVSVAHRNSVQVMSATAVTVGPTPASYDFTDAAARAFGSNQVLVDGVYTMYSGDFNQDGFVDIFDYPAYDAANQSGGAFDGTYVVTDLNGDGFVDIFDYPIYDANNQGNVQAVLPYSLP